MKSNLICAILLNTVFIGFSQPNDTIQFNLVGSPPNPRVNQSYTVGIDLSPIKDSLYKSFIRQTGSLKTSHVDYDMSTPIFRIYPLTKGKHEIGPLYFNYNNTNFSTTKLTFYVEDSLPTTNEILSLRTVMPSDSTFCLIIEQRIPLSNPQGLSEIELILKDSSTTCLKMVHLELPPNDRDKLEFTKSENGCSLQYLLVDGQKSYYYEYSNTFCFYIKNKKSSVIFTKDYFKNLPPNFNFKPLQIH